MVVVNLVRVDKISILNLDQEKVFGIGIRELLNKVDSEVLEINVRKIIVIIIKIELFED